MLFKLTEGNQNTIQTMLRFEPQPFQSTIFLNPELGLVQHQYYIILFPLELTALSI